MTGRFLGVFQPFHLAFSLSYLAVSIGDELHSLFEHVVNQLFPLADVSLHQLKHPVLLLKLGLQQLLLLSIILQFGQCMPLLFIELLQLSCTHFCRGANSKLSLGDVVNDITIILLRLLLLQEVLCFVKALEPILHSLS